MSPRKTTKKLTKILIFEILDKKTQKVLYSAEVKVRYTDQMSQVRLAGAVVYSEGELVQKFIRTRWREKK